jgi:hypothetical protein
LDRGISILPVGGGRDGRKPNIARRENKREKLLTSLYRLVLHRLRVERDNQNQPYRSFTVSVDKKIDDLIAALDRNTAALTKAGGAAPSATGATGAGKADKTEKAGKTTKAAKVTQEQCFGALTKLKELAGIEVCREIMTEQAGVIKMNEIPANKYEAVMNAAIAKHDELSSEGGETEAEEEL